MPLLHFRGSLAAMQSLIDTFPTGSNISYYSIQVTSTFPTSTTSEQSNEPLQTTNQSIFEMLQDENLLIATRRSGRSSKGHRVVEDCVCICGEPAVEEGGCPILCCKNVGCETGLVRHF